MQTYRHAVILGLGESGAAAAALLRAEGARVTVLDRSDAPPARERAAALESGGARVLLGERDLPGEAFDVCVVSPGLPADAPWCMAARARGLPVIPELELGWSRRRGPVMAVTGTSGKSTAVKWLAESLVASGRRAAPAGNYGPPACRVVREQPDLDWLVLEVSSFQLETIRDFRAEAGVLLNLAPNHLDRHGTLAAYTAAKARLFENAGPGDACIVHEDAAAAVRGLVRGPRRWITFGTGAAADYAFRDGGVQAGGARVADLRGTPFDNPILGANAAGIVAALAACGQSLAGAEAAARGFQPLAHRMEKIAESRGVTYVDDSKATTLFALAAALRMRPGKVRLIAGGLLKETDLSAVKNVLAEKVSGVYLIGRASEQMALAWSGVVPCSACGTLEAALAVARRDASPGETVLLSPGCASFDQFQSYAQRGDAFAGLVKRMVKEEAS